MTEALRSQMNRIKEPMAKPKVTAKAKPKPKITARERKTREMRAGFEKVCDILANGPENSVKEITEGNKHGISRTAFYRLLQSGDGELRDR